MFEGYDPIWTDWLKVLEMYRAQRDWEASRFEGSWRHNHYIVQVEGIEYLLSISAFEWSDAQLVWMEHRSAIGEEFWTKKMGKGRK